MSQLEIGNGLLSLSERSFDLFLYSYIKGGVGSVVRIAKEVDGLDVSGIEEAFQGLDDMFVRLAPDFHRIFLESGLSENGDAKFFAQVGMAKAYLRNEISFDIQLLDMLRQFLAVFN